MSLSEKHQEVPSTAKAEVQGVRMQPVAQGGSASYRTLLTLAVLYQLPASTHVRHHPEREAVYRPVSRESVSVKTEHPSTY